MKQIGISFYTCDKRILIQSILGENEQYLRSHLFALYNQNLKLKRKKESESTSSMMSPV